MFATCKAIGEWVDTLKAHWEVEQDPISDDYTPEEMDAEELFRMWAKYVQSDYPNLLIPIHWSVQCRPQGVFEWMPYQFRHHLSDSRSENFLNFYSHPMDVVTGQLLNWLDLPVVDKFWNLNAADKGGFLQQATGWKPAIGQPFVYLPSLLQALRGS